MVQETQLPPDRGQFTCRDAAAHGTYVPRTDAAQYPIPEKLNLVLVGAQMSAALAVLTAASRVSSPWMVLLLAVAFAFVMQLGFFLAHEAVHAKLHSRQAMNVGAGVLLFALFPGSYHFFQIAHLIHHRRNRSDAELEDYVLPTETPWLKRVTYYFLICGLFWFMIPLSSVVLAMIPVNTINLPAPGEDAGAFRRFVQFLNELRPGRLRRDLLVTIAVWTLAAFFLHLKFLPVVLCYVAFGFSWASQQYIYHVRTPRHAVLGALDLRLWKPMEVFYLYFNYHLTHHLAVWVPWIYLPQIAAEPPTQGYLETYLQLWRPPEMLEEAWPEQFQPSGPLPTSPDRETLAGSGD